MIKAAGKTILTCSTFVLIMASYGSAEANTKHTILPGDSLWKISQQYGVSIETIADNNQISDPNLIFSGQQLLIPNKVHEVKEGDTLWEISQQYSVPLTDIFLANDIAHPGRINSGDILTIPSEEPHRSLTWEELNLFARLVYSEATGEPYQGQVAVAATVLNRMDSSRYPNTLKEVIYQVESGFYQYAPVRDGRINLTPDASAYQAVRDAVNGWDPSHGATGFYNPAKTTNQWVRQQPVATTIANHVFFY